MMLGKAGTKSFYKMGSHLTGVGILWAVVSFLASGLACTGLYLPFWLHGTLHNNTDVYFGIFRQCNYPKMDADTGRVTVVQECGPYTTFSDIPSVYWQIVTVLVGTGAGLLAIIGLMAVLACCITNTVSPLGAKIAGAIQLLAGLLIAVGCILYPNGWDSHEVKLACGNDSGPYSIGNCTLSWAYYVTIGATGLCILSICLSCHASKNKIVYES